MSLAEIEPDWEVFASEGTVGIGAVRAVHKGHLVVYIEAFGDIDVHAHQIHSPHGGKVALQPSTHDGRFRAAIAHAHDRERP
ncbi:MAG: hypothetical protein RIB61_09990 [Roseicyclus sp.]